MKLLTTDPPNAAEAVSSLRTLAQDIPPNTTACRPRAHGRGRRATRACVSRDPDRTGPIARGCLWQTDGACRAEEVHDCRKLVAGQSSWTPCRKPDECLLHPNDCPGWKRTNRKTPPVRPNGA